MRTEHVGRGGLKPSINRRNDDGTSSGVARLMPAEASATGWASITRCSWPASSRRRARPIERSTSLDALIRRPCSSHVYQVTDTPARSATSSRRRPGVRRPRPRGSLTCSGRHRLAPGAQELGELGAVLVGHRGAVDHTAASNDATRSRPRAPDHRGIVIAASWPRGRGLPAATGFRSSASSRAVGWGPPPGRAVEGLSTAYVSGWGSRCRSGRLPGTDAVCPLVGALLILAGVATVRFG